jgi:hypothetical protein
MSQKRRTDKYSTTAADKGFVWVRCEVPLQYREVFSRVKWLEAIMIGASASIISILVMVLSRMP